jgi:hypothetical protein
LCTEKRSEIIDIEAKMAERDEASLSSYMREFRAFEEARELRAVKRELQQVENHHYSVVTMALHFHYNIMLLNRSILHCSYTVGCGGEAAEQAHRGAHGPGYADPSINPNATLK